LEKLNVHQKLVEVRKVVTSLTKDNAGEQYKYVSSSQVLHAVRAKMDELYILLEPRIVGHELGKSAIEYYDKEGRVSKRTTTYFTEVDMTMTWVNADDPTQKIECPWYAQGVDIAGEKGVGKALTYGEKYFMLRYLNIPTDADDPDAPPNQNPKNKGYNPNKEPAPTYDEYSQIAQENKDSKKETIVSEISAGQINMLKAKSTAAGFKNDDDKLMARVSAFLGYAIQQFESVRKNDVTRLAQHLDGLKKAS
jgi:hypothetical protein